jgi:Asp-tRNA(Asn)/Glu-tRNA(Gln) amidotransferase B subunit
LQEPDLPCFLVSKERIEKVRAVLEQTPFEKKKNIAAKYGLSIADVQTAFNYPWSLEIFERISFKYEPKTVFQW